MTGPVLGFFLEGVRETAGGAVATARRLMDLFEKDRERVQSGGRAARTAIQVYDVLKARPLVSLQEVSRRARVSFPAAVSGMNLLVKQEIAREITGKQRNRIFHYTRYLRILGEGTGPVE